MTDAETEEGSVIRFGIGDAVIRVFAFSEPDDISRKAAERLDGVLVIAVRHDSAGCVVGKAAEGFHGVFYCPEVVKMVVIYVQYDRI